MKVAIPLARGLLSPHFGHCETFALIEVDRSKKRLLEREDVRAPPHQPGLLPGWLRDRGVETIIAGGMGMRAKEFFDQMNIEVLVGAPPLDPETLVKFWLNETLVLGENVCDH